jgi:site-specific DNA-methyltransferase (adenine-specific)
MNSIVTNEDCMIGMARYPDKWFNLAIVDPPYGIGMGKKKTIGKRGKTYSATIYKQSDWDNAIPSLEYFIELQRVSINQIIFGGNYFAHLLPPSQGWFVYDKRQPEEFSMAHAELAYTSFNRAIRMKHIKRNLVQNCVSNNKAIALTNAKIHACQKPAALYTWLLKNYAKEGDKILDTHLGSGSSRIACYKAGVDFTGFELDKDYYEAQEKRFENFTKQLSIELF